jgi:hypothetical protein
VAASAGAHPYVAKYFGDTGHAPSESAPLTETVNQAPTTTVLTNNGPNPSVYGQPVQFKATVTGQYNGALTGTVTFMQGATVITTSPLVGDTATMNVQTLAVGTDSITAVYNGDSNDLGSTSAAVTETVNKASTVTTISASPNPSQLGQPVTFTALVTAASPSQALPCCGAQYTVTFKKGSTVLGTVALVQISASQAQATLTTSSLSVGNNNVTATFNGNAQFLSSTSASVTAVVNKIATSTSVTSSQNPSAFKQQVTFTATVTSSTGGTPTGTVTFYDGNQKLGTATLNSAGNAALLSPTLGHGKHNITAVYGSDATFASSTSPILVQDVN